MGSPLTLSLLTPYSETTGTKLYTNSLFYVDVIVEENGISTSLADVTIDAQLKERSGKVTTLTPKSSKFVNDRYRFTFETSTAGLLTISAIADKFGVKSNEEFRSAEVNDATITIRFIKYIIR